jgi:archaeal flagellar protein FlaJ
VIAMKYGFEISSISGGLAMIILANFLVVEYYPFLVPIFNMVGGLLLVLPPLMSFYMKYSTRKEIEEQFVSFIMDLTDSIDSGMSLPMALEHCSKRDYMALSKHVNHLVAQVNWGVPFRKALGSFARKTGSRPVQRAVSTIIETYRVGGKISDTLNSVAKSMTTINKLNAERRSSVYSQVVTSYMIFFIFIFIMVVIQVFILPSLSAENLGDVTLSETATPLSAAEYSQIFTVFIVIQGFFAGLATGKMAEGTITAGFKHSVLLVFIGYVIFSLATQLPQIKLF